MEQTVKRYDNLDGLRAYSAIGILAMHVLSNGGYALEGNLLAQWAGVLGDLVLLFMMVSAFSMCCGYYERIRTGSITPDQFYSKRFQKIWPFFAALNLLDLAVSPSVDSVYEAFANLTLCYGLLPNPDIKVIGVGWTLGVIFVFYLLFPFFCFLLGSRKRAWLAFLVSLGLHFICREHFLGSDYVVNSFSSRTNILYCGMFFLAGGMIYLYREELARGSQKFPVLRHMWLLAALILCCLPGRSSWKELVLFALLLIWAVVGGGGRLLSNRFTCFVSGISMEIYLSHMVVFRILEKLGVLHLLSTDFLNWLLASVLTFAGAAIAAEAFRFVWGKLTVFIRKRGYFHG